MTSDEATHEIYEAIAAASSAAIESSLGMRVRLQFDGVDFDTFEHFFDLYNADERQANKCACGNCGNIVVTYEVDIDENVTLLMSRSATGDETVELLEQMAR